MFQLQLSELLAVCALETLEQMVMELCHMQGLHMRVSKQTNHMKMEVYANCDCWVALTRSLSQVFAENTAPTVSESSEKNQDSCNSSKKIKTTISSLIQDRHTP